MEATPIRQAAAAIRTAHSILVACHVRPDGDALGSLLALGTGCESLGKSVAMVSVDGVPESYRFLPGWHRIRTDPSGAFDLAVGVDADGSSRLGAAEAAVFAAPQIIDIDHHTGPAPFGGIHVVDPTAAATGELVLQLLDELGVLLTEEIAVALMTAILTDTGSFRFSNVSPATMAAAGRLVAAGARPGPIYEAVYERKPLAALKIAGRALDGIHAEKGGALVWTALSQADFRAAGATDEHTDGIVGQLQGAEGARVVILFREEPNGEVRASLRARGGPNVAEIARRFGGGGHAAAAGCTLPGPLPHATRQLVDAALAALANS